jgi:hypothetical protein
MSVARRARHESKRQTTHNGKEKPMKAIVVYESLWGNTAAVARAIAEGLGPEARALSTAEATPAELAEADLVVAGAPVMAFSLPTEQIRENQAKNPGKAPPPDLSHPSMRSWLKALAPGGGRYAAFETRVWWSPGGATGGIARGMEQVGYSPVAKPHRFIVTGGPNSLRAGELEKARAWGAELAQAIG